MTLSFAANEVGAEPGGSVGGYRSGFLCPLRGACFAAAGATYQTQRELNEAVIRFQQTVEPDQRDEMAREIYARCLPLVRKTLHRFCHSSRPDSRCYPGACLPEDLVGESYPVFQRAMEDFDPAVGMDFLGFVSQRLFWGLEHAARKLERAARELPLTEVFDVPSGDPDEDRLIDQMVLQDFATRLDRADAELFRLYTDGVTGEQLAERLGISGTALRKRLQRLRERLRGLLAEREAAEV